MLQSYLLESGIGKNDLIMEWKSSEVEQYYNILNKVYSTIIINYHPYVKLLYIEPISFETIFNQENYRESTVDVVVCADFLDKLYDDKNEERSLGTDLSRILIEMQKMVPGHEILEGRKIYPNLLINRKKYCSNILEYTVN